MPSAFDSTREMLTTIDDAVPNDAFCVRWLREKVGQNEVGRSGGRGRTRDNEEEEVIGGKVEETMAYRSRIRTLRERKSPWKTWGTLI